MNEFKYVKTIVQSGWFLLALFACPVLTPPAFSNPQTLKGDINERAQPTITAEPGNVQDSNQAQPKTQSTAPTSIDFMMNSSPITSVSANQPGADEKSVFNLPVDPTSQTRENASAPSIPVLSDRQDKAEVALLVSEKCSQENSGGEGFGSCSRVYSNGHYAKVLTERAKDGDESKQQTVIEEYDPMDQLVFKKTIRHRIDYTYRDDKKVKEREFYDIVSQPAGKKTTRELMIHQYFLDTGKLKSMFWTQYNQIGQEARAGLVYHAVVHYAEDGSPERGIAEKWAHGKKIATYMNWSRWAHGYADMDLETWDQWESWIRSAALQAYLP